MSCCWDFAEGAKEPAFLCTPPSRTSIPYSALLLPTLDTPEVATVIADRHEHADTLQQHDERDDDEDTPSEGAITPSLNDEDSEDDDDDSPRSARINLHSLFEEEAHN